ncbi:MAG: hypothetical protein U0163_06725 [Gemmatimonadaceae bacterium]
MYYRVTWTVVSYGVVQSVVLGAAALPSALMMQLGTALLPDVTWARVTAGAVGMLPMYLLFALSLIHVTAAAGWLLRWRTEPEAFMPIREFGWPVLRWARGLMLTHVVRILVGIPLRGSPLWSYFVRLNGARIGRRVWLNSTGIMDHSLLSFGDDTVVGSDVHLSGHMVEGGIVKTGFVRVGANVTIGVGSVVGLGVTIGDRCQVGALSFVGKGTQLEPDAAYAGAPVHRITVHEREATA